jgi:ribosomal protein S18 acetylase RimI-like enzyme
MRPSAPGTVPDGAAASDVYRAAFVARQSHEFGAHSVEPIAPGMHGCVTAGGDRIVRLLVTDDRAYRRLTTEATAARGEVSVFERAPRCDELLRGRPDWTADRPATAMVLRNLQAVTDAKLPDGLVLRAVDRLGPYALNGVPLPDAAAVALASDPGITEPADEFARYLMGLPSSVRLFAAVDDVGIAHATAGVGVSGEYARIFFVNTEPAWRRRGVGHAMTVEALRAAASAGARHAFLNATDDGVSLYLRIGFEPAGRLTRYSRGSRSD